ncbi:hypothetical protein [uncultured Anaerococcus sp.]|nr:hypothetical protein [uncultured Anaerococcus sp.]
MTEKEKMLDGILYDGNYDDELKKYTSFVLNKGQLKTDSLCQSDFCL